MRRGWFDSDVYWTSATFWALDTPDKSKDCALNAHPKSLPQRLFSFCPKIAHAGKLDQISFNGRLLNILEILGRPRTCYSFIQVC